MPWSMRLSSLAWHSVPVPVTSYSLPATRYALLSQIVSLTIRDPVPRYRLAFESGDKEINGLDLGEGVDRSAVDRSFKLRKQILNV